MHNQRNIPKERADQWPAGATAAVSTAILIWLFFSVPPESMADLLFPNFYLPILVLIFVLVGSLVYFFTSHLRRALIFGGWALLVIWLLFQQILNWQSFLYITLPFVVIELSLTVLKKR
jgi:hypothetical protein